jgi:hypothetical protein
MGSGIGARTRWLCVLFKRSWYLAQQETATISWSRCGGAVGAVFVVEIG